MSNEVRRNPTSRRLSPTQNQAIDALLCGKSITDTAALVGRNRATIHKWLANPLFVSTMEARGRELREASRRRVLGLLDAALACVEMSIAAGDARTATKVLESLGALEFPAFTASHDPHASEEHDEADRATIAVLEDIRKRALGWKSA